MNKYKYDAIIFGVWGTLVDEPTSPELHQREYDRTKTDMASSVKTWRA